MHIHTYIYAHLYAYTYTYICRYKSLFILAGGKESQAWLVQMLNEQQTLCWLPIVVGFVIVIVVVVFLHLFALSVLLL